MSHFIFYTKERKNKDIVRLCCTVFDLKSEEVGELLSAGKYELRFENRLLDRVSDFNTEVNIYISDEEKVVQLGLYNNLLLGLEVVKHIGEVLISDESYDPYQWLLITKGQLFLVEEDDKDEEGISLRPSMKKELSIHKSLKLLPGRDQIFSDKIETFFVKPSTLWNQARLR